jgi:hypothetical protein
MEYMIKGMGFRKVRYGQRTTRGLRFLFRENEQGRK